MPPNIQVRSRIASGHPGVIPAGGTYLGVALAAALLLAPRARAHDTWANGDPVPAWVKADCCTQAHAHHILNSAVHVRPDGYHVDGYPYTIPFDQAHPSPDGSTWLFYSTFRDGTPDVPLCFFVPPSGA